MKKITITTSVAIIIGSIIISAAVLFANSLSSKGVTNSKNFVDPDSMFAGRAFKKEEFLVGGDDKKVVLVEYSDMECPFCKKLHVEVSNQIYKNYGDKLGVVFRHFPLPFHKKAKQEALATLCAREIGGQAAYRNYIEKVYEKTQGNDTLNLEIGRAHV